MAEKKGKKKNSAKKLISGLFAKKKTNKPTQNGRKKIKNSKRETIIIVILTLLAVGAVVFFAARSFGGMKYNDVEDSAKQLISASGTGAGYPYKISSADVLDMTPFKSNIALLTRDSVVVLNSSAKEVARLEHNYSDPDMAVYKGRALVYDRTSGDFTLMNSSKILGDGNTGSPIYTAAMGKDGRISPKFLHPGPGYGGSCFPKDTKALNFQSDHAGVKLKTVKATIDVNREQRIKLIDKARRFFPDFRGVRVAIIGLTFKPGTDDLREAPAKQNIDILINEGASVIAWDPLGVENFRKRYPDCAINFAENIDEALTDADVCFIMTEWEKIVEYPLDNYQKYMRRPLVFDGRNCYKLSEVEKHEIFYDSIGRKIVDTL